MFYNAKNGVLKIEDTDMHYISFGNGPKNLIMIPGLGDGLKTAKGIEDHIVTGNASEEMVKRITDCELYMYEGYGHGVYE